MAFLVNTKQQQQKLPVICICLSNVDTRFETQKDFVSHNCII